MKEKWTQLKNHLIGMKEIALAKYKAIIEKIFVQKDKKSILIAAGSGSLLLVSLIFLFYILTKTYVIDPRVKQSMAMIPDNALFYVEFDNINTLYGKFEKSKLGKSILASEEWKNLRNLPELRKFNSLLYLLSIKADQGFAIKELLSFCDGSIGYGFFANESWLVVSRINIKSKIGLALLSELKSERVNIQVENHKTEDKYVSLYNQEKITWHNLQVSKINLGDSFVFYITLGDFLFLSENIDLLKESVFLASNADNASLAHKAGMKHIQDELESDSVDIFIYLSSSLTIVEPIFSNLFQADGLSVLLKADTLGQLSGGIYLVEEKKYPKIVEKNAESIETKIPFDQMLTIFSREKNLSTYLENSSIVVNKDLFENLKLFLNKSDLENEKSYKQHKSFSLVFHSLDKSQGHLYPQVSFMYESKDNGKKILESFFKNRNIQNRNFQNQRYSIYPAKLNQYYNPGMLSLENFQVLSSDEKFIKDFISTGKGSQISLSDSESFGKLGEFKSAPFQVILNIPKFIDELVKFYEFGAVNKSSTYSVLTIEKDVKSIFEPIKELKVLHIAMGEKAKKTEEFGRIIIY